MQLVFFEKLEDKYLIDQCYGNTLPLKLHIALHARTKCTILYENCNRTATFGALETYRKRSPHSRTKK